MVRKVLQGVREAVPSAEFTGVLDAAAVVLDTTLVAVATALLVTAGAVLDGAATVLEESLCPPHAARPVVIAPSATIAALRATITENRFICAYSPMVGKRRISPARSQRTGPHPGEANRPEMVSGQWTWFCQSRGTRSRGPGTVWERG